MQYQFLTFVFQYFSSYHQIDETANTKKPGKQNRVVFFALNLFLFFFSDVRSCNEFQKVANQKLADGEYPLKFGNETFKVRKIQ